MSAEDDFAVKTLTEVIGPNAIRPKRQVQEVRSVE